MKITMTIGELFDKAHDVDDACQIVGLDPWCLNEGRASKEDEITLTEDQAKKLRFL